MRRWLFVLLVCNPLSTSLIGFAPTRVAKGQERDAPSALEIRLGEPLKWESGCIAVSLYRTNHTSEPLFLPNRGVYIDVSVGELPDETGRTDGIDWVNVYGLSDIGDWDATPIGPGVTVHDQYCLPSTVAVVNQDKKTRREMQLRGTLRIKAYFFPTKEEWLTNKRQHQEMFKFNMTENELRQTKFLYPQLSMLVAVIPCMTACPSLCDKPANLLHGEQRVVPDIYEFMPGWNKRGLALNDEMARRSETCSVGDLPVK
jgi:hypothetical protein